MLKEPPKYNLICLKCKRNCKQHQNVSLLSCPLHDPDPVQLEIKVPGLNMPFPRKRH